jgi:acetyl-CoA carboxylase carboxyl transferase subunit beta
MSWFKRDDSNPEKKPKKEDVEKTVRTEGLWQKCEGCREIIWKKDLEATNSVCPRCGAHFRLEARTRLAMLFDNGEYEELDAQLRSSDPLQFVDNKPYSERLLSMHA